ncbi:hypothetical protein [Roseateles sp. LYH14W]|uniref:Uncharacterized protein n=1 Tax=Pelomonas parva TaxID=3299032 RepID=A0ABW7FAH8_9BURK
MSIDKEHIARNYAQLSDEALQQATGQDLLPEARALLDIELENRRKEREEARRIAGERARANAERKAQGLHELDAEGRAMLPVIPAANMAQGWCKSASWVLGILGVFLLFAPPHIAGLLLIGAVVALRFIRTGLRQNSRTAAVQFLIVVPVSAMFVVFGFALLGDAVDSSFRPSLRGLASMAWFLVLTAFYYLWGVACWIFVALALRKEKFLDDDALQALERVTAPYDA